MGGTRSRPSFPWKARPDGRCCARSPSPLVLHSITRGIFETIVEQAPLAIEELMNELEAQEEEEEEETSEGEEQDRAVLPGKPPRGETPAPGSGLWWLLPGSLPSSPVLSPRFWPSSQSLFPACCQGDLGNCHPPLTPHPPPAPTVASAAVPSPELHSAPPPLPRAASPALHPLAGVCPLAPGLCPDPTPYPPWTVPPPTLTLPCSPPLPPPFVSGTSP